MKKLTLMIDRDLMNKLGLNDQASDEALTMAIKTNAENAAKVPTLQSRITVLETENTTLKKEKDEAETAANDKEVEALLADALTNKKSITVELSAQLKEDYQGKPDALKKVLNTMKPFQSITEGLKDTPDAKAYEGKTFDELHESGQLEAVKNKLPELYAKLYKDAFGKEPKGA